jgi:uncharacterized membrane protein
LLEDQENAMKNSRKWIRSIRAAARTVIVLGLAVIIVGMSMTPLLARDGRGGGYHGQRGYQRQGGYYGGGAYYGRGGYYGGGGYYSGYPVYAPPPVVYVPLPPPPGIGIVFPPIIIR